jgi:hypothetical protein
MCGTIDEAVERGKAMAAEARPAEAKEAESKGEEASAAPEAKGGE